MEFLRELWQAVDRRLERIDFAALWPGFQRCPFALYGEGRACLEGELRPRPQEFLGNTALEFEGRYIAIWNADEPSPDLEELTADLVHEMFHAFQFSRGESRFADELAALDYPQDVENFNCKLTEDRLLVRAFRTGNLDEKRSLLSRFRALRDRRESLIGGAVQFEYLPETVEGMAEYVGTRALAALSPAKYQRRLERHLAPLAAPTPLLLDVRRMAYHVGPILLLTAETAGLTIHHRVGAEPQPVYRLLADQLPAEAPGPVAEEPAIPRLLAERRQSREEILARFMAQPLRRVEGEFTITSYDPMNMWKLGNRLYGSDFWQLRDRSRGREVLLMGESVLDWTGGSRCGGYWTPQRGD